MLQPCTPPGIGFVNFSKYLTYVEYYIYNKIEQDVFCVNIYDRSYFAPYVFPSPKQLLSAMFPSPQSQP